MKFYLSKRVLLNCKRTTLLILKKEVNEISFIDKIKLSYHLKYCMPCRHFAAQSAIINKNGIGVENSIFNNPPYSLNSNTKKELHEKIKKLMI
jgi:hypothetical protein